MCSLAVLLFKHYVKNMHVGIVSSYSHCASLLLPHNVHVDADGGCGLVCGSRARLHQAQASLHHWFHCGELWSSCPLRVLCDSAIRSHNQGQPGTASIWNFQCV